MSRSLARSEVPLEKVILRVPVDALAFVLYFRRRNRYFADLADFGPKPASDSAHRTQPEIDVMVISTVSRELATGNERLVGESARK